MWLLVVFFFKQKTAYEMRISDWSSDVCSSDLLVDQVRPVGELAAEFGLQFLAEGMVDGADGTLFVPAFIGGDGGHPAFRRQPELPEEIPARIARNGPEQQDQFRADVVQIVGRGQQPRRAALDHPQLAHLQDWKSGV